MRTTYPARIPRSVAVTLITNRDHVITFGDQTQGQPWGSEIDVGSRPGAHLGLPFQPDHRLQQLLRMLHGELSTEFQRGTSRTHARLI